MPTSLLFSAHEPHPLPHVIYAVVVAVCFVLLDAIWLYAWRAGLMTPTMNAEYVRRTLLAGVPGVVLVIASIPLSYVSLSTAAVLLLMVVPVGVISGWWVHRADRDAVANTARTALA